MRLLFVVLFLFYFLIFFFFVLFYKKKKIQIFNNFQKKLFIFLFLNQFKVWKNFEQQNPFKF